MLFFILIPLDFSVCDQSLLPDTCVVRTSFRKSPDKSFCRLQVIDSSYLTPPSIQISNNRFLQPSRLLPRRLHLCEPDFSAGKNDNPIRHSRHSWTRELDAHPAASPCRRYQMFFYCTFFHFHSYLLCQQVNRFSPARIRVQNREYNTYIYPLMYLIHTTTINILLTC